MAWGKREDYGPLAVYTTWTMFVALTALRIYCRLAYGSKGIIRGVGLDDIITIVCWVLFLITCALITVDVSYGSGKHESVLSEEEIIEAAHWNVITNAVAIWVFSLPKFAIVALLRRILTYGKKTAIMFWGLAITSQALILAVSIWWFRQCTPVAYGWDKSIAGGSCADVSVLTNLGYFTSAYSAFLDTFFALYPIPLIMRLNLGLKNRITISFAMSLSALASAVSIYKLAIFGEIFAMLPTDPTYPSAYLDILGMSEGFILLASASLPTLGPLVRAIRGKTVNGSHGFDRDYYSKGTREASSARRNSWSRQVSNNHNNNKQFDDDIEAMPAQVEMSSSRYEVDEIPLVEGGGKKTNSKKKSLRLEPIVIHKNTEIEVHSEPRTPDSRPGTRQDIYARR
ncbi:hypothetical protein LQW54_011771 [Pestalotiopsis sp. IQ-011]